MIRQQFSADGFWEVVVYYDVDYHFFDVIEREMKSVGLMGRDGINERDVKRMRKVMGSGEAKAVTISSTKLHLSMVLFNKHQDVKDYLNSIVHEAEHVKQAMLKAYKVDDRGEPPAYTIGYLVGRMWEVFQLLL